MAFLLFHLTNLLFLQADHTFAFQDWTGAWHRDQTDTQGEFFFWTFAIQHDDLKRLLKWVCLWIPFDNNNQKHFPETLNWTECIYYIGEGMHHNLHVMQDIDKALYVAEFHQEEEQEEC